MNYLYFSMIDFGKRNVVMDFRHFQEPGVPYDRLKRGPDFVAERGDKLSFACTGVVGFLAGYLDLLEELRIVDGNGDLVGKDLNYLQIFRAECVALSAFNLQHTDQPMFGSI